MLAKNPGDRFQTPVEVAYALQPFMGPMPAAPSGMTPRSAPVYQAAPPASPSPVPAVYPTAAPIAMAQAPVDESRTDSHFRLPAPAPRREPPAERSRWNLPIALVAGLVVLGLLAGGVYLLFIKNSGPDGPNLDKQFKNRHDMPFNLIAAGSFDMGSPDGETGRGSDEGPVHPVKITQPFYMGATEVTLRQYHSVVKKYPFAYKEVPEDLDIPVANLSVREVQNFFKLLNNDEQSRKPAWEYRLPTEAEWEYACRAGTKARFSTGDNLGKNQAYFNDPAAKAPAKVGQYPANAWGLHDMHGNVAEWVYDFYDDSTYANSPPEDPKGPGLELRKTVYVVRGGGFLDPPEWCRCARRKAVKQEATAPDIGFRAALVQQPKP
jgi:formylglycine-generating enzyme required for sulfatase activity